MAMDNDQTRRAIRQTLKIDQLLGMSDVPVRINADQPASDSNSDAPESYQGLNSVEKQAKLQALDEKHIKNCTVCSLSEGRTNTVFGEGNADADLMFIGEGPGQEEDRLGRPFVGRAGKLLDKQIEAMNLSRENVYIANIAKCRPPSNRVPTPDEAGACRAYLDEQIDIIQPKVIVALGATASKLLLDDPKLAITRERGTWREYRGIDVMPTFHPAYLLRQYTQENRRRVWDDLKKVLKKLDLPLPE